MKVIALKPCFIGGEYRRLGDVFYIDEKKLAKDAKGNPILSKSKNPAIKQVVDERAARAEADKVKRDAEEKLKAGAIAASGGKAAKEKADVVSENLAG